MSEPIFLCTQDQWIDPGASEDRAVEQLALLGRICERLGYQMMSGVAPNFHEIWARRVGEPVSPPAEAGDQRSHT